MDDTPKMDIALELVQHFQLHVREKLFAESAAFRLKEHGVGLGIWSFSTCHDEFWLYCGRLVTLLVERRETVRAGKRPA